MSYIKTNLNSGEKLKYHSRISIKPIIINSSFMIIVSFIAGYVITDWFLGLCLAIIVVALLIPFALLAYFGSEFGVTDKRLISKKFLRSIMENENFEIEKTKNRIFVESLDLGRTKRIYIALEKLSVSAVEFLQSGKLKEFSFAADKMRPLLSYIADNNIKFSQHLDTEDNLKDDENIKSVAKTLNKNLQIIYNTKMDIYYKFDSKKNIDTLINFIQLFYKYLSILS